LELGGGAGSQVGRHAAVDHVEDVHRLPFLALGRVDGRQDQIVLVQQRHTGLVAGRVRRIQGEFRQEAFARGISAGYLFKLNEVGAPDLGVFVDAVQVWFVPEAGALQVRWPFRISEVSDRLDEGGPIVAGAGRGRKGTKR